MPERLRRDAREPDAGQAVSGQLRYELRDRRTERPPPHRPDERQRQLQYHDRLGSRPHARLRQLQDRRPARSLAALSRQQRPRALPPAAPRRRLQRALLRRPRRGHDPERPGRQPLLRVRAALSDVVADASARIFTLFPAATSWASRSHLFFASTSLICLASSISMRGTSWTSFTLPVARMVLSLKCAAGSSMPASRNFAAPVFVMMTAKFFASRKSVSASR